MPLAKKSEGGTADVYEVVRNPLKVTADRLKTEYHLTLQNGLSVHIVRADWADPALQKLYVSGLEWLTEASSQPYLLTFDTPKTRVHGVCVIAALTVAIAAIHRNALEDVFTLCIRIFVGERKIDTPFMNKNKLLPAVAQAIRLRLDPNVATLLYA